MVPSTPHQMVSFDTGRSERNAQAFPPLVPEVSEKRTAQVFAPCPHGATPDIECGVSSLQVAHPKPRAPNFCLIFKTIDLSSGGLRNRPPTANLAPG